MSDADNHESRLHDMQSEKKSIQTSKEGTSYDGLFSVDESDDSKMHFYLIVALLELVGLIALTIVGIWMGHFRGGFKWDGSGREFNYHPVFMVVGMVFLYGNAMIIYRVFRNQSKFCVKLIHGIIQLGVIVFAVLGLVTVFNFHNAQKIPNMYSLHSWLGMGAVVLFCLQWLFGALGFVFPKFGDRERAQYLVIHQYFGVGIFLLVICACLTGITEKLLFSLDAYSKFVAEGNLANILGLSLVIFAGLVLVVALTPAFRRPPEGSQEYMPIIGTN